MKKIIIIIFVSFITTGLHAQVFDTIAHTGYTFPVKSKLTLKLVAVDSVNYKFYILWHHKSNIDTYVIAFRCKYCNAAAFYINSCSIHWSFVLINDTKKTLYKRITAASIHCLISILVIGSQTFFTFYSITSYL